jgi:hypothetical protein
MTTSDLEKRLNELELELVTQRLVTRSLILYLLLSGDRSIRGMIEGMSEASRRTSGDVLPLEGVHPELQARASAVAKMRGEQLVFSLGKVLAAERNDTAA